MPGIQELIIILIIVAVLFGGRKIPELAKGLGLGIKNFKNAVKEDEEEKSDSKDDAKILSKDKDETKSS